ncbi:MAG: AraC family transcriptional regulator [Bacteroidales bacterium]|nr:AraC family transcriptional regulator [Bacteroidales bacterium]
MEDNINQEIFTIDNNVRLKMRILDIDVENIFRDRHSLILDFSPYRKYVKFGKKMRTQENRLIINIGGEEELMVNSQKVHSTPGTAILIREGSIISSLAQSDDIQVHTLAFTTNNPELKRLIMQGAGVFRLDKGQCGIIDIYYSLFKVLLASPQTAENSIIIDHALLSMVHLLAFWAEERRQQKPTSRAENLCEQFLRNLFGDSIPERRPEVHAERLHVSKGYLNTIVKKVTSRTVMDWINERMLLEAEVMLGDPEVKMESIADRLSMNSAAQFSKFYSRLRGETPTTYRRRCSDIDPMQDEFCD